MFWIAAVLMVAGACMFVLPPMLRERTFGAHTDPAALNLAVYREQLRELDAEREAGTISFEQHRVARGELEQRVLNEAGVAGGTNVQAVTKASRRSAVMVGLLIAGVALGIYWGLGSPGSLEPGASQSVSSQGNHAMSAQQIAALVEGLSARLKSNPEDGEGWAMLARSYGVLGRHQDALLAYQQAVKRIDGNAALLVDYADTLALMRGRKLAGQPYDLVKRALVIDPRNLKALALAGTAEFDGGNPAGAIEHWEKILALVPADAPFARSIAGSIEQARKQVGGLVPTSTGSRSVAGTASLSPAVSGKVDRADTVYVYARAAEGPRMPLAIMKRTAADLPFEFRLDDSMAMGGGLKLSQAAQVVVGVRVSKSGSATPRSGDLEGVVGPLKPDGSPITVVVDRIVP